MNEQEKDHKTLPINLGAFQFSKFKSHCFLQPARLTFLIYLLILLFFFPANSFAECISGDCINGYGIYKWPDGMQYEGEWKDGKRNGQGTNTLPDGSAYAGEWKDDKRSGQGTRTNSLGDKFTGEFRNDKMNGQGTYIYHDGRTYMDDYKDGLPAGQGVVTYPDGRKYVGEVQSGVPNGQGNMTYSDGRTYAGQFKSGVPDGQGTWTQPVEGENIDELKDGNNKATGTANSTNYIVLGGILLILSSLIYLFFIKQRSLNKKDDPFSKTEFGGKEEYEAWKQSKINPDKNVTKEADTSKESSRKSPEHNAEIDRCYEVLQLRKGASIEEIKKDYKDLLIVWDPNKHADGPVQQKRAQEKTKEIKEAYDKLLLYHSQAKRSGKGQ